MSHVTAFVAWLSAFFTAHAGTMSLLGLAFVVTMREALPPPFDRVAVLVWFYGWLHDALKTFVNFGKPNTPSKPKENT